MVIRLFTISAESWDYIADPVGDLQRILDEWDGESDLNIAWLRGLKVEIVRDPAPSAYENLIVLARSGAGEKFRPRETFTEDGRKVSD